MAYNQLLRHNSNMAHDHKARALRLPLPNWIAVSITTAETYVHEPCCLVYRKPAKITTENQSLTFYSK